MGRSLSNWAPCTYALFFLLFRREVCAAGVAAMAASSESSGRALIRGLMSPTTGVAFLLASAACCSLACLMELISKRTNVRRSEPGELAILWQHLLK